MAYLSRANELFGSDQDQALRFSEKAYTLVNESIELDPEFGKVALSNKELAEAYRHGAFINYESANYAKAWEIVRAIRASGHFDFEPGFIELLSAKLPPPE